MALGSQEQLMVLQWGARLGLYIGQLWETCLATKWVVNEVTVGGRVDLEHKGGKLDEHPTAVHTKKATATLTLMGPKTVEGATKVGDMQHISNKNLLTIEREYGRAPAKNRSICLVAHSYPQI